MKDERAPLSLILTGLYRAGTFGVGRDALWDACRQRLVSTGTPQTDIGEVDRRQFEACITWLKDEGVVRENVDLFMTAYGISRMIVKARRAAGDLRPYLLHEDMSEMSREPEADLRAGGGRMSLHEILFAFAR